MAAVTNLYVVRHGETVWNTEHRMQGHQDSPLTELGKKQAAWLGEALERTPIDAIYCSDSPRAVRTAEIIRGNRTIPVTANEDLRELHLGEWEGRTQASIREGDAERLDRFWNAPELYEPAGGETFEALRERVVNRVNRIAGENECRSVLLVSHTVAVKVIMSFFENRPLAELWNPPYIHPVCLSHIVLADGAPSILLHGDISHYKE